MLIFQVSDWGVAEYLPISGTVASGYHTYEAFRNGDIVGGIVHGAATLVSAVLDAASVAAIVCSAGSGTGAVISGKSAIWSGVKGIAKDLTVKTVEKQVVKTAAVEVAEQTSKSLLKRAGEKILLTQTEKQSVKAIEKNVSQKVAKEVQKLSTRQLKKQFEKETGIKVTQNITKKEMQEQLINNRVAQEMSKRKPLQEIYPNLFKRGAPETGFFKQFKQLKDLRKLASDMVDATKFWAQNPIRKTVGITMLQPGKVFTRGVFKDYIVPSLTPSEKMGMVPTKINKNQQQQTSQQNNKTRNQQQQTSQQNNMTRKKIIINREKLRF